MSSEDDKRLCLVCKATEGFHQQHRFTGVKYIIPPKLEARWFTKDVDELLATPVQYDVRVCSKFV